MLGNRRGEGFCVKVKLPQLSRRLCTEEILCWKDYACVTVVLNANEILRNRKHELCATANGVDIPQYEVTVMMLKQLVETLLLIFQLVTCKATDLVELSSLLHNKGTLCKAYSV